jgi:hypothetical protein
VRRERASWRFGTLAPGVYDFQVRLRGFPDPVASVPGLRVDPGPNERHAAADVDLRDRLFRFRLRAMDQVGRPIRDPGSPLLARIVRPNGSTQLVGFPWRGGRVELFSSSPRLVVVQLGSGTRPREQTVPFGDSDLVFERLQPVHLEMPGVRAMCGAGRRVRVSMVLTADTGLPSSFRAEDQASGRSRSYSRAQLGKSGGAWLGDGDVVSMPLMRDGEYRVVLRLYERGVDGPASRGVATVDVRLSGHESPRYRITVDPKLVNEALQELRRRKSS